jgi:hypothetical protein
VLLKACRYLAVAYAIGLAIGETVINSSQEHWQYAPLWIIDYVIVAYLLVGFSVSRGGRYVPILMSAYALSAGVLYIEFFLNLDPDLPETAREHGIIFTLIGIVLGISVIGLVGTTIVWLGQEWERFPNNEKTKSGR